MKHMLSLVLFTMLALPVLAYAAPEDAARPAVEAADEYIEASHRGLMDVHASEMLWTIIVFVIFFLVLSFVVWPKILGGLQAREDKQRSDLLAAENANKEAQAALAKYQEELSQARAEAQKIVEEARKSADMVAAKIKADSEEQLQVFRESAKRDIAAAKEQALSEIYEQAATVAAAAAGKILEREINADDQRALVEASLAEITRN